MKTPKIREDIVKLLGYSRQLDAMEHFLDQQFKNIKADRKVIKKYILEAVAYLERCNIDLVENENEINKEDTSVTSPTSPSRSISK